MRRSRGRLMPLWRPRKRKEGKKTKTKPRRRRRRTSRRRKKMEVRGRVTRTRPGCLSTVPALLSNPAPNWGSVAPVRRSGHVTLAKSVLRFGRVFPAESALPWTVHLLSVCPVLPEATALSLLPLAVPVLREQVA